MICIPMLETDSLKEGECHSCFATHNCFAVMVKSHGEHILVKTRKLQRII